MNGPVMRYGAVKVTPSNHRSWTDVPVMVLEAKHANGGLQAPAISTECMDGEEVPPGRLNGQRKLNRRAD